MKRALPEPATSAAPVKRYSALNNTDSFTSDSIPPHYYHLGEENYGVVSDFGDVLNVHIRKFRRNENGESSQPKMVLVSHLTCRNRLLPKWTIHLYHSETGKVVIVGDSLFLSAAWIKKQAFHILSAICDKS
ncbi:hypothetical protein AVEN_5150-1 [Araneus ventricosus]|uniref:Uncharacterized protein n=1 Tax=Araneus ventricosus TaxID=182803 RepID=A0A4Y2HSB6_ARAVE|nr:hypothetical protein AVEN_5150-1 [Araneus ventricosus]